MQMKRLFQILTLLFLFSCTDSRTSDYETIINQVDNIKIEFKSLNKTVELNKEYIPMFKEILIRDIKPTVQQKFKSDTQVDLYSDGQKVGFLMINNNPDKPFVNFGSDKLNFGFGLTYGIGMYLDEIKYNSQQ
jgi:hypothetical protein